MLKKFCFLYYFSAISMSCFAHNTFVGVYGAPASGKGVYKPLALEVLNQLNCGANECQGQQPIDLTPDIFRDDLLQRKPSSKLFLILSTYVLLYDYVKSSRGISGIINVTHEKIESILGSLEALVKEFCSDFFNRSGKLRQISVNTGSGEIMLGNEWKLYSKNGVVCLEALTKLTVGDRRNPTRIFQKGEIFTSSNKSESEYMSSIADDFLTPAFGNNTMSDWPKLDASIVDGRELYKKLKDVIGSMKRLEVTRHSGTEDYIMDSPGDSQEDVDALNPSKRNLIFIIQPDNVLVNFMQNALRMVKGDDGGRDSSLTIVSNYFGLQETLNSYIGNSKNIVGLQETCTIESKETFYPGLQQCNVSGNQNGKIEQLVLIQPKLIDVVQAMFNADWGLLQAVEKTGLSQSQVAKLWGAIVRVLCSPAAHDSNNGSQDKMLKFCNNLYNQFVKDCKELSRQKKLSISLDALNIAFGGNAIEAWNTLEEAKKLGIPCLTDGFMNRANKALNWETGRGN